LELLKLPNPANEVIWRSAILATGSVGILGIRRRLEEGRYELVATTMAGADNRLPVGIISQRAARCGDGDR
jgi:hypothetical protein